MGDSPVEPLLLLVVDTTLCVPALDTDTDPVDRSHQQSTATLSLMSHRRREGESAELAVGEKRLVKGTFPHVTPFVLRRPLTRPLQRPFRRRMRPARPGPIRVVIMSARTSTPPAPAASRTARRLLRGTTVGTSFSRGRAAGDRRVRRQSPPPAPSKSLTPFTSCWAHCPWPSPPPMSRTFSPVIRRG